MGRYRGCNSDGGVSNLTIQGAALLNGQIVYFSRCPYAINGADAGIPAVQFSCPRWAADNQGPTEYVPPHSKNEIQSWSQLIATIECLYLQVLALGGGS